MNPSLGWAVSSNDQKRWTSRFYELGQDLRKSGSALRQELNSSGVSQSELYEIWSLADIDKDGALDADEFAVCMHLIECVLSGMSLPNSLPNDLIPPSKRGNNSL